jgi:protein SCO1/2
MQSKMMRFVLVGILVVMAAGVGWLTFDWYRKMNSSDAYGAPFTLVDQNGAEISEAAFRGHPSAVFFGFTHCPEVCPTTLVEMDSWLKKLGDEGRDVRAYFVSIDPERDTPETMDTYVGNVSDRITGITGDPEKVAAMAKAFGIFARKVPLDGGDYTMDHTASVLLLNREGGFFGTISYGENPDTALAKLKRLIAEG